MNPVTNRYEYEISDRLGTLLVAPLGESDFTIEWERQDEDKLDYEKTLPSKIVFLNEAFANLYKLERSIYRCDFINITIRRRCLDENGFTTWVPWLSGRLSLNDGDWDIARCMVTVKLDEQKDDQCFTDNKGTDINLLEKIFNRVTVRTINPNITIEKVTYNDFGGGPDPCEGGYYWGGTGDPYAQGWAVYYHDEDTTNTGVFECHRETRWARQKLTVACGDQPPSGAWILLTDTCPSGSKLYAKPVDVYGCTYTYPSWESGRSGYTMDCKIVGDTGAVPAIDNGMHLKDCLNAFINEFCPGIQVRSNFFYINPDQPSPGPLIFSAVNNIIVDNLARPNQIILQCTSHNDEVKPNMTVKFNGNSYLVTSVAWLQCILEPTKYSATITTPTPAPDGTYTAQFYEVFGVAAPINYVTGARSKTDNIVVFQKSDVKRPNATGNASKANINFEKFMQALVEMFNCRWRFEGNIFRIEHISWYSKNQGLDLTMPKYAKYVDGMYKYSYDTAKIPQREEFTFMEAGPGDFTGLPIKYSGGCVSKSSKDNITKHSVESVTTDVQLCLDNPANDSRVVDDAGLVFMATQTDGTQYWIISEQSILGGSTLNNSLAWAQLHRDYHKYYRPLRRGNMNGVDTGFFSVKPTKKGDALTIPLCCGDVFNPDDLVTTMLGQGTVDKATFSFKDETVKLDLLYPADDNLVVNTAPVANNDLANTYVNVPVTINVLANDTDADTGAQILGVEIVLAPTHGQAVVNPDNTVTYTPSPSYTGDDYLVYRCWDDWHEYSNNALVSLHVYPENQPPVANDDAYTMNMGTVLNVPAPGVFANDHDDVGFTLDTYTPTSTQGGTVVVNADGSFTYTPPSPTYFGTDTFQYTIKDAPGLTDSATVTITIRNPNNPTANNDAYSTVKNTNLTVAAPGVLQNDSIGAVGSLAAVPGTIATAHGGSATLNADGSFTYVPPAGFTGTDTWVYQATNGAGGTDDSTVTVTVFPPLFIRMVKTNQNYETVVDDCSQGPEVLGDRTRADYFVYFYSNSAGTVPFDVTGLGLVVNVQHTTYYSPGGTPSSYIYPQAGVTGRVWKMHDQLIIREDIRTCTGSQASYYDDTLTLSAGNYTII